MLDRDFETLLESSYFLAGLDPFSRTALAMHLHPARFAPDDVILAAGAVGDSMYILLSGSVRVQLPGKMGAHIVARLGPDHLLGEIAFFGRVGGRIADVVADGDVDAAQITRATYNKMVETDPGAAETLEKLVLDVMLTRVADTDSQMVAVFADHPNDPVFQAEARMLAGRMDP